MSDINYAILGSGSSANSYYIEFEGTAILIDNGFSFKELSRRATLLGVDLNLLKGVMVSHDHSDHMKGVGVLTRKLLVPVYIHHEHSSYVIPGKTPVPPRPVVPDKEFSIGPFTITPYETSHDAAHSINFHVSAGGSSLMVLTDSGQITKTMRELIDRTDILFLEANYEKRMLENGPYPYYLKKRIDSDQGHLSNSDALELIDSISDEPRPQKIYLCHMSDTNNHPDLLKRRIATEVLSDKEIIVCSKGSMHSGALRTGKII